MSSENSTDFKKLIKEVGLRKAIELMKEKGVVYSGDFTDDHRTDLHFSTPYVLEPQKMDSSLDSIYEIAFSSVVIAGNIYQQNSYPLDKPLQKIPCSNSIFDMAELVVIPTNYLESQETTSGMMIMPSPQFPSINQ